MSQSSAAGCPDVHQLLHSIDPQLELEQSRLSILDDISKQLAGSLDLRAQVGRLEPSIWPRLQYLWTELDRFETQGGCSYSTVVVSVARFTRNLVAGVPSNQEKAFAFEGNIRKLVFVYTSFSRSQLEKSTLTSRMLVQTLSNIVTGNDSLAQRLWDTCLRLPEEQNILIRGLSIKNDDFVTSHLVFLLNCIHQSRDRGTALVFTTIGRRVCILLLDRTASLFVPGENSGEVKRAAFEIGQIFFSVLFTFGLMPPLFSGLAVEGEAVAPHQITLLKCFDSYLAASKSDPEKLQAAIPFISEQFCLLSMLTQQDLDRSSNGTGGPMASSTKEIQDLGPTFVNTCGAVMILAMTMHMILLFEEEDPAGFPTPGPKRFLVEANWSGNGFIEALIALLRLLHRYLPRVNAGEPGIVNGFDNVKRELVKLLGALAYNEIAVQERTRLCEGIPVVLSLCVHDERNPYIREHAIFALRNILHGNVENQAVVDQIQPVRTWDENGELRRSPVQS